MQSVRAVMRKVTHRQSEFEYNPYVPIINELQNIFISLDLVLA